MGQERTALNIGQSGIGISLDFGEFKCADHRRKLGWRH